MAIERYVEGPTWTGFGIHESAGRYPLRVEGAVSNVVGRLLPGVITTTRHARMYSLHVLAWATAHQRSLDQTQAAEFVRRCEVVIAGIHHFHEHHRVTLSSAHGEGALDGFLADDRLDVAAAAELNGLSAAGFADVYAGPSVAIGTLTAEPYPRPGIRADVAAAQSGLGELLELAERPSLTVAELRDAGHLCLCEAAAAEDGRWLRRVLVEDAGDRADDRHRQLTCLMLLESLNDTPSANPTVAFRDRWAFGPPEGDPETDERAMVAALWRAAVLRNFSVGAWRALWRWLAAQLNAEPMTAQQLGERLAAALDDMTVANMLDGLPARMDGSSILPAETALAATPGAPMRWVRELALGAQRLRDLEGATLRAFVGTDPTDLGPRWVDGLLEEARGRHVRDVARELAVTLVRRAQRVALSKMYLTRDGRPFVPTRLRDRDGILSVRGEEGAGDVALRLDSLADVMAGLGYLGVRDDGAFEISELGEALRARYA
jgi:hypothetical protein